MCRTHTFGADLHSRGQSALEYLVTYGWAILAIVIIGAALSARTLQSTPEAMR
ncbi:hypothetical protein HY095_06225 [Candidatus Micrarchaeota archaeon]|nr:hypothetical protein [Candidatus Micrarchaeota archaeon]